MITTLFFKTYAALNKYSTRNPFTWVYGLARSVLALGTLINLVFNGPMILFDYEAFNHRMLDSTYQKFNIFYLLGYDNLWLAYAICIVVLLLVIWGVFPRITGILHWLVSFSFFTAATIVEGGDQLTAIITLLLIPVTLLDPRTNHWHKAEKHTENNYSNFTANVFMDVIRLQMAVLYLHAGIDKLYKLEEWRNGTALYYFFNDPLFGRPEWLSFLISKPLTNAYFVSSLTWGTIIFELILFGTIFMGKARRRLFVPAVMFHLGIAVIIGLVSFSVAMTGGLILYLLPRHLARPAVRAWFGRLFRSASVAVRPEAELLQQY